MIKKTPNITPMKRKSLARTVMTSRVASPGTPGWVSGADVQFKTPVTVSPAARRVTRRMSVYQSVDENGFGHFKIPTSAAFVISPPGVKTRARRSSMYQASGRGRQTRNLLTESKIDESVFVFKAKPVVQTMSSKAKAKPPVASRRKTALKSPPAARSVRSRTKANTQSEEGFSKVYNTPKALPSSNMVPSPLKLKTPSRSQKKPKTPKLPESPEENKALMVKSTPRQKKAIPMSVEKSWTTKESQMLFAASPALTQVKSKTPENKAEKEKISNKVIEKVIETSTEKTLSSPKKKSSRKVSIKLSESVYGTPSGDSPKVALAKSSTPAYGTPVASRAKLRLTAASSAGRTPGRKRKHSEVGRDTAMSKRSKTSGSSEKSPEERKMVKAVQQKKQPKSSSGKPFDLEQLSPQEMSSILKSVSDKNKKRKAENSPSRKPSKIVKLEQEYDQSTPRVIKAVRRTMVKKLADIADENTNSSQIDEDDKLEDTDMNETSEWDLTINSDSKSSRCIIL